MINSLTPSEMKRVEQLKESMDDLSIQSGAFYHMVVTETIGVENLTLEDLHDNICEIENIDVSTLQEADDTNGVKMVGMALGVSSATAANLMRNPRSASVLFRALRDKLEESEDRLQRANAESRGLIASIVYSIKKAIVWLVNKFKEVKDDILDTVHDRPLGASQAKRDYEWIKKNTDKWMSGNTGWYHVNDHMPTAQ